MTTIGSSYAAAAATLWRIAHHALLPAILALFPFLFLAGPTAAAEDWTLPRDLQDRISGLPREQQRFISSGDVLTYMPSKQLEHELGERTEEDIATLVADIMAVAAMMGYDATRDMGAVPLNLESEYFNRGSIPTPEPLRDLNREPGPFSVHRYLFPESGVPTFAGARVALYPEDLVAGNVDVAIVGVPNDMGSTQSVFTVGCSMISSPRVM